MLPSSTAQWTHLFMPPSIESSKWPWKNSYVRVLSRNKMRISHRLIIQVMLTKLMHRTGQKVYGRWYVYRRQEYSSHDRKSSDDRNAHPRLGSLWMMSMSMEDEYAHHRTESLLKLIMLITLHQTKMLIIKKHFNILFFYKLNKIC